MQKALAALIVAAVFAGSIASAPSPTVIGALPSELAVEPVSIASISGSRLSGWFLKGRPHRGAILLMHGIRANRLEMVGRARLLNANGFSVLLFDFQAHGRVLDSASLSVSSNRVMRHQLSISCGKRRPASVRWSAARTITRMGGDAHRLRPARDGRDWGPTQRGRPNKLRRQNKPTVVASHHRMNGGVKPLLVIFDCDGVLVDSEVIACELHVEHLKSCGVNLTL
jgi:hypothetical protein